MIASVMSDVADFQVRDGIIGISYSWTAVTVPDCLHGLLPGPFHLSYSVLFLFFPYLLVSVPCARLSWPSRQLLSARKSIISYRMVLLKYRSFSRGLFFIGALRSMFIGCRLINGERVIVCLIDEHLTRTGSTINRDRTQWPTQDLEIGKVDWRILGGQTPIRLRV